jgi:hypothetical protein
LKSSRREGEKERKRERERERERNLKFQMPLNVEKPEVWLFKVTEHFKVQSCE